MKKVNAQDLRPIVSGGRHCFQKPLFTANDEEIFSGDRVEFYIKDEIFPHSGTVSTLNGKRVECFNQILNKWEYYEIEEKLK